MPVELVPGITYQRSIDDSNGLGSLDVSVPGALVDGLSAPSCDVNKRMDAPNNWRNAANGMHQGRHASCCML